MVVAAPNTLERVIYPLVINGAEARGFRGRIADFGYSDTPCAA